MANRFPLILDTSDSNKIKELPSGDNLDLTGSGIIDVVSITSTGSITTKDVKISGYTTSERNALSPVRGQFIYNTSIDQFQGYSGSDWRSLQGIDFADLSVINGTPSGAGSLSYNNNTGVFVFTPSDATAQSLSLVGTNLTISGGNTISIASLQGVNTFVGLNDTPANFASTANYFVKVNTAETALEFVQDPGYITSVAFSDITSRPSTLAGYNITDAQAQLVSGSNIKSINSTSLLDAGNISLQETLVSGTNIKTINGNSLLGSGDINIAGGGGGSSAPMNFAVGADDSTMRQINTGESIKFIGGTGIDTTSDTEGNITITATGSANTGDVTFSGTTIDSSDSSGITFTPTVTTNSDLIVENNIRCSNVVFANSFQSTGTGVPAFTSNSSITLSAVDRINVTRGPIKQASFTTVGRDALSSINGDIIYNTTTNAFQGRANGSWVNLSGSAGIANVVEDTTPQLGGDLDVNGKTVKYQFNITNDNTDHYVFTDPGSIWFPSSENDPTLYLRRGEQYLFNNTSGGHPFRIQSTTGTSGTPYSTGVTNNGGTGQVIFKVPMSAPATLYYQCTSHTNMNGTINIV
tara:strand:- start:9508 stop:11253 length:1746 start_codon:yes stop_codon:yes gene_type:complete